MDNIFYELRHEIGADYFTVERNHDFSFPLHMHRSFEIILLLEGEMTVTVEKREYPLSAGEMIFIKPNYVHSLQTGKTSRHILCIFSPELIGAIADPLILHRFRSPVIQNVPRMYRELFESASECMNLGAIKGILYTMGGLFYGQLDLTAEDPGVRGKHLLRDIFRYVDESMDRPCSLRDLGETLGYSPAYLSRFFHAGVGMPYSDYVRNVKISHACYLLRKTRVGILDIAAQCGYSSISSFNRNFKQMTGCSPSEYKREAIGNPEASASVTT